MAETYQEVNSRTWDKWAEEGNTWTQPISHEVFERAKRGEWCVLLTPCVCVPHEWFPKMEGARVLGLASGGGQQMPVFAALGASCTVFDNSKTQLDSERVVAEREGYEIEIIKGDMTKPLPFADDMFDLIFHPVSNCFVEDVLHVWRECFRVLKPGGVLLAGMDNGINYLLDDNNSLPITVQNPLPFNPLKMPPEEYQRMVDRYDGVQFSHSITEQLGGQLEAGLVLTHIYEDRDRPGESLVAEFTPQYIASRAIKPMRV